MAPATHPPSTRERLACNCESRRPWMRFTVRRTLPSTAFTRKGLRTVDSQPAGDVVVHSVCMGVCVPHSDLARPARGQAATDVPITRSVAVWQSASASLFMFDLCSTRRRGFLGMGMRLACKKAVIPFEKRLFLLAGRSVPEAKAMRTWWEGKKSA